jgi:hypothetical protein
MDLELARPHVGDTPVVSQAPQHTRRAKASSRMTEARQALSFDIRSEGRR